MDSFDCTFQRRLFLFASVETITASDDCFETIRNDGVDHGDCTTSGLN